MELYGAQRTWRGQGGWNYRVQLVYDGRTDTPSYRNARTYPKIHTCESHAGVQEANEDKSADGSVGIEGDRQERKSFHPVLCFGLNCYVGNVYSCSRQNGIAGGSF